MAAEPLAPADEFRAIVRGDFCSGCGACSVATRNRIPLRFQPDGRYLPEIDAADEADLQTAASTCPFSSHGPDEDEIAARRFPDLPHHPRLGRHAGCHVGHVAEGEFRSRGSSGGLTSWIAAQLLEQGDVAGVLHVQPVPPPDAHGRAPLFRFAIARNAAELAAGAKSHYYPVEVASILGALREGPEGRIAVIGIPCFLKALHRLTLLDPSLARRIGPTIGLVCGHLKTAAFAELLAWQTGIAPKDLAAIDFRVKLPDRPATDYGMAATATDGRSEVRPMSDLAGRDWGQGWFRLNACSWCDDVMAETADISVGDAWLPGWAQDSAGTNVVVTRSSRMHELITQGIESGRLAFQPLGPDEAAESQAGGFRYRHDALAQRRADAHDSGRWVPVKRIRPARTLDGKRRRQLELRETMARTSREGGESARTSGDFGPLLARMQALIAEERRLTRPPLGARIRRRLRMLRSRLFG